MKTRYLLGIDIGTSSTKVLLADSDGRRIAQHTALYKTLHPSPGYVEQRADETWWAGAKEGISSVLAESRISPSEIAGVCASGMVPNLCPLDEEGHEVRPTILYRDNRAVSQVRALKELSGFDYSAEDVIPKLLWLKENEPENYLRTRIFLNSHAYVAYRLTGRCSIDHDIASIHGDIYDRERHTWLPEKMEQIGLDPSYLPPVFWPYDIVGYVTEAAASETGLVKGTPVICGTGDSYTACVGSGTVNKGDSLIYLGTAATMIGLNTSLDDALGKLFFSGGNARFLGNVLTGGEITHWAKDAMYRDSNLSYGDLEAAAKSVPAGSRHLFALPHLLGRRTPTEDPYASGVLFGLTNAHHIGHIYRALLEGVAYNLKDSLLASGFEPERIVLFGGGSRCGLWRQILADVLDRELLYCPDADNAIGTVFLAGRALGFSNSFEVMRDQWLHEKESIRPDERNAQIYGELFEFYRELDRAMTPLYRRHSALA